MGRGSRLDEGERTYLSCETLIFGFFHLTFGVEFPALGHGRLYHAHVLARLTQPGQVILHIERNRVDTSCIAVL